MITGLSHATVFVLDQDRAKDFYTDKLGFELRNDVTMGDESEGGGAGFRWLTVGAKGRPDLEIILSDPAVKSVFVNVFGGITACDAVANGIVTALGILGDEATKPLVVRLDGNNVEEGRRILAEANHPLVTVVDTMDGAARRAAELAA